VEGLLEEMRIKLSSVVSDVLGASGLRALAQGQTDAGKIASLGLRMIFDGAKRTSAESKDPQSFFSSSNSKWRGAPEPVLSRSKELDFETSESPKLTHWLANSLTC
jgi:hypothetical protein